MLLNNYVSQQNYADEHNDIFDKDYFFCITDRTQEDVDRVRYLTDALLAGTATEMEYLEFLNNMRGALNYSDLNRIEKNLNTLAALLGITLVSMERATIPRVPYYNNLLLNVGKIRDTAYRLPNTPLVPNRPLNTYTKINDIEKILRDAYVMYRRNEGNFSYCGDGMYAGNDMLL